MQSVTSSFLGLLRNGRNNNPAAPFWDWVDCFEFYAHDYLPSSTGFDPDDAIERFSSRELTHNGFAYKRAAVSRSAIRRFISAQENSCTLTLSNLYTGDGSVDGDRYVAAFITAFKIEGMWLVVRTVERSNTTDSLVLFVGRCDKPGNVTDRSVPIKAKVAPMDLNANLPLRDWTSDDPLGRHPSDPLYEGIRFIAVSGTNTFTVVAPSNNFFGRLFGRENTSEVTSQWSSVDGTPQGHPRRMVLGRAHLQLVPFLWADRGNLISSLQAASDGPIAAIQGIQGRTSGYTQPYTSPVPSPPVIHLGDPGGTGTNNGNLQEFKSAGKFSRLAYIECTVGGGRNDVADDPPEITALVKGMLVPLPNASGVYNQVGWTDNPVHLARALFIWTGTPAGLMQDSVIYQTALHCDEPIYDDSNAEIAYLPSPDFVLSGTAINRFRSTGIIDNRWVRHRHFGDSTDPFFLPPMVLPFEEEEDPDLLVSIVRPYRRRYTFNAPINEKVKAVDFLRKTLYPAARLYDTINHRGAIEIKSERAADNAFLRAAASAGATQIKVDDVTRWKASLQGKVLIGLSLLTSEVRRLTSAQYSADGNSITLDVLAVGTITATKSGATLAGGSTSVQATGTVTIGGTPEAFDTVTITINGIALVYTLDSFDTTNTVAAMLQTIINADSRLNRFIDALWNPATPTVVTIKSKYGVLNFADALDFDHAGPTAAPVAAPTLTPSSGGSLPAGTYKVARAYVTAIGKTTVGPPASVVVTANQKITVSAITLPAGITDSYLYVSESPDSDKLLYIVSQQAAAVVITALPNRENPGTPPWNSTAEETIRVAMSYSSNMQGPDILAQSGLTRGNMKDYTFPMGGEQSSVNVIKGSFRNASLDFALVPFTVKDRAHIAQVNGKEYVKEVDLSGVDNWNQAYRIANGLLSQNREGDWFNSLLTGTGEALLHDEGDVICASADEGGHINVATRIEELEVSPDHEVKVIRARRYSTLMFLDEVRQHEIRLPSVLRYTQPVSSAFIPLDIPLFRETDYAKGPGLYIAVNRGPGNGDYRGSVIFSNATGAYVAITPKIEERAVMGSTWTALGNTSEFDGFDAVSTVRIKITTATDDGELVYKPQSTDAARLAEGANLAAIGRHGRWELIQFRDAVPVAGTTDSFDLDYFKRGLHGTSANAGTHTDTDLFVLLTDADGYDLGVRYQPLPKALIIKTFNLKAVTINQDVSDAAAQVFNWKGLSSLIASPVNPVVGFNGVDFTVNFPAVVGAAYYQFSKTKDPELFDSPDYLLKDNASNNTTVPRWAGAARRGTFYIRAVPLFGNPSLIVEASYYVAPPQAGKISMFKPGLSSDVLNLISTDTAEKYKTFTKGVLESSANVGFEPLFDSSDAAGPRATNTVQITLVKPAGTSKVYIRGYLEDAFGKGAYAYFNISQPTNVALIGVGAVASASSIFSANYPASAAQNGDRKGLNPTSKGLWTSAATLQQVETATVVGTITGAGNVAATIRAAGLTGSPLVKNVAVLNGDSAAVVAGKIRAALAADATISGFFTVSGTGTAVVLTKKQAAANDGTLNIALANGTSTGLTAAPTSANTRTGVAMSQWLQIACNGIKSISEINVFMRQDGTPVEPTLATTFTLYGLVDFQVQYLNAAGSWVTVAGGNVTGNNKVWRQFKFTAITTDKVRVLATKAVDNLARLAELEAIGIQP